MARWLVLDVNYLCWRNYHAGGMRELSHNEIPTGVMFGLLRDIGTLQTYHSTTNIAFCFDHGESKRKKINPEYKASREVKRNQMTPEEKKSYTEMGRQLDRLKFEVLPQLGFRNIFLRTGLEADDMIACFCQNMSKIDEAIIVSADHDLYQLLSRRVSMWTPGNQQFTRLEDYKRAWGLSPGQWVYVKAIAGCQSDDIAGVPGVGEKTAAKFIKGEMTPKGKKYDAILAAETLIKANLKLVRLPLVPSEEIVGVKDEIDHQLWNKMVKRLGMTSLVRSRPKFR